MQILSGEMQLTKLQGIPTADFPGSIPRHVGETKLSE